jgi:hypothetical protein
MQYTNSMVKLLMHVEGLIIFLSALFLYSQTGGSWWLFLLFLLTPDISMIGYLRDKKLGALLYNLVHNYVLAFILMVVGLFIVPNETIMFAGIILLAHVGLDRLLGYGLKYPSNFKDTHLQKV